MPDKKEDAGTRRQVPFNIRGETGFYENKGQILDQTGNPRNDIRFSYLAEDFQFHITRTGFSFELISRKFRENRISESTGRLPFAQAGKLSTLRYAGVADILVNRTDVECVGASTDASVMGLSPFEDADNFYISGLPEEGVTNVRRFRRVLLREIWPNIDVLFDVGRLHNGPSVKYSFILRPGARISDIRMRYKTADLLRLEAHDILRFDLSNGSVTEKLDACYAVSGLSYEAGSNYTSILLPESGVLPRGARKLKAAFLLDGMFLTYAVDRFDSSETVVIDPTLQWATYYGGTQQDYATGVATDANSNVYACGWTHSSSMIATSGAHQTSLIGTSDAFVVRFSSGGVRTWGTYLGGDMNDFAQSVSAGAMNTVLIAGNTASTTGLATAGGQQTAYGGGQYDGFMAKLNASGVRQWATYVGGPEIDECFGVSVNAGGNIACSGRTASASGVASAGAHQSLYGGGSDDAFVAYYNASGVRLWSTYFGGSESDNAASIAVDGSGAVVVAGTTSSTSGIASIGAHSTVLAGVSDAFVARFSPLGVRQWSTYYGGPGTESGRGVALDANGFVVLAGAPASLSGIATPGAHQQSYQLGNDAFVARFSPLGTRQWGTYYGGAFNDDAFAVAADANGDIFIAGITESGSGIATPGSHQAVQNSVSDAFIAKFSLMGGQLWGSYFGGGGYDVAYAVAVDAAGAALIAGLTSSSNAVSTSAGHQPSFGGGLADAFVAKFNGTAGANEIIILSVSKDTLCAGESFEIAYSASGAFSPGNVFVAQLSSPLGYFTPPLQIGQISSLTSGTITAAIPTTTPGGVKYRVRVVSSNPPVTGADNGRDIVVFALPDTSITMSGTTPFCDGDSISLCAVFRPSHTYQWKKNGTAIPGAVESCYIVKEAGEYSVFIENEGRCEMESRPRRVTLLNSPYVAVTPADTVRVCEGQSAALNATFSSMAAIQWLRDGVEMQGETGAMLAATLPGVYTARAINSAGCASLSNPVTVVVLPKPNAAIHPAGPVLLCDSDSVLLGVNLSPSSVCRWMRDGSYLPDAEGGEFVARVGGEYRAVVTNEFNCTSTSQPVRVTMDFVPRPEIDPAGPIALCKGDSIRLTSHPSGPWKIRWFRDGAPLDGGESSHFIASEAGEYSVEFKSHAGCVSVSAAARVEVRIPAVPRVSTGKTYACDGDSIILRATPVPGCTIAWMHNGSIVQTAADTLVARTGGRYVCYSTDSLGCKGFAAPVDLVFETLPVTVLTIEGSQPACAGDTVMLIAEYAPNALYVWFRNDAIVQSDTATTLRILDGGLYRLAVTSRAGCSDTSASVFIDFIEKPELTVTGPASVCEHAVRTYSAKTSMGARISWSISGGTLLTSPVGDTVSVRWSSSGEGYLFVRASGSVGRCSTDTLIKVAISSKLMPGIRPVGSLSVCEGDSISLTADPGYASYKWNTGARERSIVVRMGGCYFVEVADDDGCEGISPQVCITIKPNPVPVIMPSGSITLCGDDSVTLDAGSFARYQWSTGDTGRTILVRPGRDELEISVSVENESGCSGVSDTSRIKWRPRPRPMVSLSGTPLFCEGDSLILSADSAYSNYLWSDGSTERVLTVKQSGHYFVSVLDSLSGCRGISDTVPVFVYPIPDATIQGPYSVCTGTAATFSVPHQENSAYLWQASNGSIVSGQGAEVAEILWTEQQTDTVRVTVTGPGGCRAEGMLIVGVSDYLRVRLFHAGTLTVCAGDTFRLTAPPGYIEYRWSTGDSSQSLSVTSDGGYWVKVRDSHGCEGYSDTAYVRTRAKPLPIPIFEPAPPACEGDTVVADAGPDYASYLWFNGETTRSILLHSNSLVQVHVTDQYGCRGSSRPEAIEFLSRTRPYIRALGPTQFCEGDSVILESTSTDYDSYRWSTGEAGAGITVRHSGLYWLTTDSAGRCPGLSNTIHVVVNEFPPVPAIIRDGVFLHAPPAYSYRWYRNDTLMQEAAGASTIGMEGASYVVEVADSIGCSSRSMPHMFSGSAASTTIAMPVVEAAPGQLLRIPLLLTAHERFIRDTASFVSRVKIRKDLFYPIFGGFTDEDGMRTVFLSGRDAGSDTVAFLEGIVTLGSSMESPLNIDLFAWADTNVSVATVDGVLRVRVCEQGGARLFDGTRPPMAIGNRPNPFNNSTVIEFQTSESGYTELAALDVLGRKVATLVSAEMPSGAYTTVFEAGNLPSGVYLLLLSTQSMQKRHIIEIVK